MKEQFANWLAKDPDINTRNELQKLIDTNNTEELTDRFNSRLQFGTAGLRGKVGVGTNRMNRLVIQESTLGLGLYLLEKFPDAKTRGVIVGYDGRLSSKAFADDTAAILLSLGIKVYLTYKVSPTPLVAFGVHALHAVSGVMITASHNPPEYNGYKVYWENAAQIIPPHDTNIAVSIDKAAHLTLSPKDLLEAKEEGLLIILENEFYDKYFSAHMHNPFLQGEVPHDFTLAYTALHGVGAYLAQRLMDAYGVKYYSVKAQELPDGNFPTVRFPNPEENSTLDMVIEEAKAHNTILACANDPDADRLAVAARDANGEYKKLTGDQIGTLFADYLLKNFYTDKTPLVGTTIVSTRLLKALAHKYNAHYYETLTGFKWLANGAMKLESAAEPFLFGFEEAIGYTVGDYVRDKDGISSLLAFIKLAAQLYSQHKTVWDRLEEIYQEFGIYLSSQISIKLQATTSSLTNQLRQHLPQKIAGFDVLYTEDFSISKRIYQDGKEEEIDLPKSDVLTFILANNARIVVRPSGTEPKVKCYYEIIHPLSSGTLYADGLLEAQQSLDNLMKAHQASL